MSAAGVPLHEWHGRDPRLSKAQERALADLVCHDQHASILGFDWAYLPVVEALLGEPVRVRRYSIGRDGSPCLVDYGAAVRQRDPFGGPGGALLTYRRPRGDGGEHADGDLLENWLPPNERSPE